MDSSKSNRLQLAKCLAQLAERAEELEENEIACCCFAVAASIIDGSYPSFAVLSNKFSVTRLKQIEEEEQEGA